MDEQDTIDDSNYDDGTGDEGNSESASMGKSAASSQKMKPATAEEREALEAKMAAKREYHRLNAAASRRRNKEMVEHLKSECARLTTLERELAKTNKALKAQVSILKASQGVSDSAGFGVDNEPEGTMSRLVDALCSLPQDQKDLLIQLLSDSNEPSLLAAVVQDSRPQAGSM